MNLPLILMTDSYKASHWKQYPEGTTEIYSYMESRGSNISPYVVFFGLQYYIKKYLMNKITYEDIRFAKEVLLAHGEPFNESGWMHILNAHHGYLPIEICSVAEGYEVPNSNVLMTIRNTDTSCYWLTNYMETLLMRVWYPTTVATISNRIKKDLVKALVRTDGEEAAFKIIPYMLHDFGARGVSSSESSMLGGMAHLTQFKGTDNLEAIWAAREYYNVFMAGQSVPAAEHSTITVWGKDNEVNAYRNMLEQYGGHGKIVSVVSDSYDVFNACENLWGTQLRQEVIDSGATVVIRPDSGDPKEVVMKCLNILADKFGYTTSANGFKVLKHVKILQGDGVNPQSINAICDSMILQGFAISNIVFGMGGALLQKCDRDTFNFAIKCSNAIVNGENVEVFKDPITASNKASKKGKFKLTYDTDMRLTTISADENTRSNYLLPRYRNGQFVDNKLDYAFKK